MHHITKVSVEGFWETYDFDLRIFPQVTFLIGANGTGKTTLINLIAAALTADFRTLDRIPFKKITINLNIVANSDEPRITVLKSRKKDQPFEMIEYRVKSGGKGTPEIKFSLGELEEQVLMRRVSPEHRLYRDRDRYRFMSSELISKIQEIVSINWLSVHRAPTVERAREERSFESAVDQRLEAISNELIRFFSTLSRRKDEEVRIFQESVFISLIEAQVGTDLFATDGLANVKASVQVLSSIFKELHVSENIVREKLSSFEQRGTKIHQRMKKEGKNHSPLALEEAVFLLSLKRVSAIVEKWNSLQEKINTVFAARDNWLKIGNDLFQRKKMELTESNELQFISRTGKILTPQMLSSGEKQLLILLSETLLQRERPSIFIADEPELSLHVLWQEKLVASLRALNPAAQIIVATHSPDIVGLLADKVIDMETIIP